MIIKERFIKILVLIGGAAMLMMSFSACNTNKSTEGKAIKGVVVKFERPALKFLTMEEMMAKWGGGEPPTSTGAEKPQPTPAVPAIYINNGKYVEGQSKKNIVTGGEIKDNYAFGVNIAGEGNIGGVVVKGIGSEYTLSDANIELSGDISGGNMFGMTSTTAGATADDHAMLTIRNSNITCSGSDRNAISCTNHSTVKVYDSTIIGHGAPFDPTAAPTGPHDTSQYLEVKGNTRASNTMSNSYIYFYNSTIIADGWGACSTDGAGKFVRQELNNCKIQTIKSGYGAYADWNCHDTFNNCEFNVACMAIIAAGESEATFRDTKANCGTYFALMHCVTAHDSEVGNLKVIGGEIACKSPVVIVKSHNAIIKFDDVKIATESGILLKSIVNPDPNATPVEEKVYGIHATFKDMNVAGDIIHEDTDRTMAVYLESATLKGAIKDAYITLNEASKWIVTADSKVTIMGNVNVAQIDAPKGVTINAVAGESGTYTLAGGGTLILKTS